jgi:hypothetical protein
MFARAAGTEVHLMGRADRSLPFARSLGFDGVWAADALPELRWNAVIGASNAPQLRSKAMELVEPGKLVACIGLAASPSPCRHRVPRRHRRTTQGASRAGSYFTRGTAL